MEKERRNCSSRASSPKNTVEQDNLTKPERLLSNLKHLSFAADLLALANQAAEEYESLPVGIEEDAYEQGKRELMMQQRAKSLSTSHNKATKVVEEARGLELHKSFKKRDDEPGLGVCKRFVGNSLCETLKPLSFDDLLVLANTASVAFHRQVSRANGFEEVVVVAAEEYLPSSGVEEHTCKRREDGSVDRGGSCFGLPEELRGNRDLMQQRGLAAPVKVVKEAKPDRDPSDGCREDKLFDKKYVRKKRVNNKEHLESTSVGAVAGTSNLVKKSCINKSSSLINVDDAQRGEEGLYNNGETQSKSEQVGVEAQGGCSGIKNKTKSKTQSGDENQEITHKSSLIPHILGIKNQEIPKRKRSQRKRKLKEPKKNSGSSQGEKREEKERAWDQTDSDAEAEEDNDADKPEEEDEEEEENTISEADLNQTVLGSDIADEEMIFSESEGSLPLLQESETEEEEDVSDASSYNWWSFTTQPRTCKGIRNVQWRNKKKRNCMTSEETQSNRKILLVVEAITNQLGLLDISMKEKKSS